MQQTQPTSIVVTKVGTLGLVQEKRRQRLGVYTIPGDEVMAIIPGGLGISWRDWEPGCTLIEVPGFPRYPVLGAACLGTSVYVIVDLDDVGARRALLELCTEDLPALQLITPRDADCLILATDASEGLWGLLRRTAKPRPRTVKSHLPPAALVHQLPRLFNQLSPEGRTCTRHLALCLFGDERLHMEAIAAVLATAQPAGERE